MGKSTLFNRLSGRRQAITNDRPGVTRDCITVEVEWGGRRFTLMDTGGFVPHSTDSMETAIREQAESAVVQADIVLLLCDGRSGPTDSDAALAGVLRRSQVPALAVVNKLDNPEQEHTAIGDFFALGLGTPIAVSAATGRLSGDLLDTVVARIEVVGCQDKAEASTAIRLVLAGRPNVGKSTLMNRLSGFRVSIVHETPGTTRDTTDFRIHWRGHDFLLMDTAGLRRRTRVEDDIEYYSSLRATNSIAVADVTLALVDAVEGATAQDARIMTQIVESGSGMVVAVNKWDAVEGPKDISEFTQRLQDRFPFLRDFPVVVLSALTGSRVSRCLETSARVFDNRRSRVATARLNKLIQSVEDRVMPSSGGREIKILYATQQRAAPPTFVIFANHPELVSDSYRRHVEKSLRNEFGFEGAPLRLYWRARTSRGGQHSGSVSKR